MISLLNNTKRKVTALSTGSNTVKNTVDDVINWFLSQDSMSPKKLQKLLYYAYSWDLIFNNDEVDELNQRLFSNEFEAWVHGPVIPRIWRRYKDTGSSLIDKNDGNFDGLFDEDTLDTLVQVWDEYGSYNGNQLESITHQESPWKNARQGYLPLDRCNVRISDEDIFECYIQRITV
ncbi:SocA family protein [Oceanobacillus sp. ISL-73]|nr:SocA family protein [Oceanobacillus sp. ISL-74]MBT2653620.1 SocA family protein [Oceanobacillus sp. ISL-73]